MRSLIAVLAVCSVIASANPAPPELSFEAAVAAIALRSTALHSKKAALEGTRASNLPSRLSLLPTISVEGSIAQGKTYGQTGSSTSSLVQGVGALNLFKFGADFAAMSAASSEIRAAEEDVRGTELQVEKDASETLSAFILAESELAVRKRLAEIEDAAYKIAQARYKQGLLASQESEKVLIDLENAKASLNDAEIRAVEARAHLRQDLGHTDVQKDWPWKDRLKQIGLSGADMENYLRNRPDWLAAEARVAAIDRRADQRWGEMLPSLDALFSYGHGTRTHPGPAETVWEGKLQLTIPLFDRLAGYSQYRERVHARSAAEQGLEEVRRNAKREWESASQALELATTSAKTREKTVTTARKLYEDNVKRFHRGLISANDLVVDQTRLADAELFALRGWANAHNSFSKLCSSLGLTLGKCLTAD